MNGSNLLLNAKTATDVTRLSVPATGVQLFKPNPNRIAIIFSVPRTADIDVTWDSGQSVAERLFRLTQFLVPTPLYRHQVGDWICGPAFAAGVAGTGVIDVIEVSVMP